MSVKMNAEVAKTFFTQKGNNIHVCVCGKERKQLPRKGYTNLISHITVDHPEWQQELSQKTVIVPYPKVLRYSLFFF